MGVAGAGASDDDWLSALQAAMDDDDGLVDELLAEIGPKADRACALALVQERINDVLTRFGGAEPLYCLWSGS